MPSTDAAPSERLARLLGFLESDPTNASLLSDAADAALNETRPELAKQLLDRRANAAPLAAREHSLVALAAMQLGQFDDAVERLRSLQAENPTDPALRFNLAWSLAMTKDFRSAADLLAPPAAKALPQAATLRVQLLHQLGEFEEAMIEARSYLTVHADYIPLHAATSVLALDLEDEDLARACALGGGADPDAMTTLATLELGADNTDVAIALFDRALEQTPDAPRALIGRGLAQLSAGGDPADAARTIERGAEAFSDHLGSWIAAGWAYLVANDRARARAAFEHALSLDRTFGESHGSLAALAALEGDFSAARQFAETARRLDAQSFSAAFALAMISAANGREDHAQSILNRALTTPIDKNGRTIAQHLARRALRK